MDDESGVMESSTPHRIDPPSPTIAGPVTQRRQRGGVPIAVAVGTPSTAMPTDSGSIEPSHQGWLELHADELIRRLQVWSVELDAREAQLNVRASLQDNRERQFRLHQQGALADQAEQQRSIQRQQNEIEAQARRLAFREICQHPQN